MTTRKTRVDNYIAHTNQLMDGLKFFGKNYMEEEKLYLSSTYSYAYWLLCQSIELIDEGERIYEMISTSLMYDFKDEMEILRKDYVEIYSQLKVSLFEEIELNGEIPLNPDVDKNLLSLLDKYVGEKHDLYDYSFSDAYKVLSNSREKLHDAGVYIYRLLECTLGIIKKQCCRYRHLRNRTEMTYMSLFCKVIDNYMKSDLYRKDLDGFYYIQSQEFNSISSDEDKLIFYKEQISKTISELSSIPELGDIWKRAAGNYSELACNIIRYEYRDEYQYNRFINLLCLLGHLDDEISKIDLNLESQQEKAKEIKKKGKRGNKKTVIFIDIVDEIKLAQSIRTIYDCYYSTSGKRIEIGNASFDQTDFLVSIYFALVKLGIAISALLSISSSYYDFLVNRCDFASLQSKKTYDNHLSLIKAEGKDFHFLNNEIIAKNVNSGGFRTEDFPLWQQMVAIAEEVLKSDEYIKSILKNLNNGNSSEFLQHE